MADPPATTLQPAGAGGPDGLLATKLYLPRLQPGFIARPRLAERLDEGLARGLVLVCAPAGFGKPALLADWARQGRRPVAWPSLDLARLVVAAVAGDENAAGDGGPQRVHPT